MMIQNINHRSSIINHFIIWFLIIISIFIRYWTSRPNYKEGDKIRITTKIISEPIRYDRSQYLKVENLKVYLPLFPEINYGDRIVLEGVVADGGLKETKLIEIKQKGGFLYKIRQKIISFYQKSIPEPHSSLVAGVTLGSKASIPAGFWESLKKSGTAHVVVASGMNVTLVAGFLINFLILFMPRFRAVLVALVGVWLYALLSGFDAPIVRAAIMGSIAFSALALGRLNYAWRGLLISAAIMLIINPLWISDLGFILSFVATASLLLFGGAFKKIITLLSIPSFFKEGFYTSLAAQVGVAPILYYTFGYFSILSPIISALVLWTIPTITVIGMLAGIVGVIFEPLGRIILYLVYPLTSWFVLVVGSF